ncbi:MAG: hypothetical protein LUE89_11265 [Clostridiales bacterium]|nr:hypothetical protein [Clostridiales bacterium]
MKYGIPSSSVYRSLYSGRIEGTLVDGRWDVKDVPPPPLYSKMSSATLGDLTDYEIGLIWLNGTLSGKNLLIRSKGEFLPKYFSGRIPGSLWQHGGGGQFVFKTGSMQLLAELREIGFTGRKDAALCPPPVNPLDFAAALVESRCSFSRQLHHSRNRQRYYAPCVRFCASYPIMEQFVSTLSETGVIPPRKLTPAANQTSATLRITSREQMEEMHCLLSPIGQNQSFWDEFWVWAHSPKTPH